MLDHEKIDQYDLVEIIQVPAEHAGLINIGDVGVVLEKYDEESFEIECAGADGTRKWLETLNIRYVRLRSKDPYDRWAKRTWIRSMTQRSVALGSALGTIFGALIGAGLGAITWTLNGILLGLAIGLILGALTGALTAALTVRTAGTTGGVGTGYFTGMLFGGAFGMILGALLPTSLRISAHTEGLPVLDALAMGRFETAILAGFVHSILATIVAVWVSGKNFIPRNSKHENEQ